MIKSKHDYPIESMPLLALRGLVVFPGNPIHFDVGRPKSVASLGEAMQRDQTIFLVTQRDPSQEDPSQRHLYSVGVVAKVRQVLRAGGDTLRIMVDGLYRARLLQMEDHDGHYSAKIVRCAESAVPSALEARAYLKECRSYFNTYCRLSSDVSKDMPAHASMMNDIRELIDYVAANVPLAVEEKQKILHLSSVAKRAELLLVYMERECEVLLLEQTIQSRVQEQVEQNQKEYYLREQMKAIAEELGEGESPLEEADEYRRKIRSAVLSEQASEHLLKEVHKLSKMPSGSHEATVVRNYLDTVLELPWGIFSKGQADIVAAAKILDRDHYGLQKVKDHILELMAVWQLTEKRQAQILCLVGPPGVGKTSIARSIAHAIGREYVRVSLGGVRDESDIRGHRKTYIGAMMGRIMTAVKQAKTANPLVLLDEIDKLGSDFRGDPSAALLEVLDPEQNHAFVDHYVELPFDLSQVLFITTANDASTIPAPLYDRMDVLTLPGYTQEEKLQIAKKHLVKKQLAEHGLTGKQLRFTDKQLRFIIEGYTREAGVRQLERLIAKVCRQVAKRIVEGEESISTKDLTAFLGPVKYKKDADKHADEIGLVNGLAWTQVGGELLPIEVAVLPGTGKIELTGSLGDVMKESARIAISYVRAHTKEWTLQADFYTTKDIHIHAPEGAVPKDGPSAGITMATAILSALAGIPVKGKVAMTGELSLRGRVLPIGGLKEKLMAAYVNGMQTVLIPADNVSDLEEVDTVVKEHLTVIPVHTMEDVLYYSLTRGPAAQKPFVPAVATTDTASTHPVV